MTGEENARATLEFAILDAIAETADLTGLRAGDATDALVQAIADGILDPPVRWAVRLLSHAEGSKANG